MQTLAIGKKVTNFSLNNQANELIELEKILQHQRILLYFYPKALTPGCTIQAESLRDHSEQFINYNVKIIGISPDPEKKLQQFVEKKSLNFDLLSDSNHQIADQFGVWGEKKFMGKVFDGIHRVSFLIGQDSVIQQVFQKFKTKDHHQVILDWLDANPIN